MARIYIPELDKTFETISAAAKAAGVDPSNVGKVIRGKRQTAGGFHFARIESLQQIPQFRARVKSQKQARKKQKTETKRKNALLKTVHDKLVDVNKRVRNAKKANTFTQDMILQQMLSHAGYFGFNKSGGYNTQLKNLRQFSVDELSNLLDVLTREQQQYTKAARNDASIAAQFGISTNQYQKYKGLAPLIFDIFKNVQESRYGKYDELVSTLYDAMQDDVEPEELQDIILDIKSALYGNAWTDIDEIIARNTEKGASYAPNEEEENEDDYIPGV